MPRLKKKAPEKRSSDACLFCNSEEDNEETYGKLLKKLDITVHYFCMLFSSGLWQKGKRDRDGILGFMPADIYQEHRRGNRLTCQYCRKKGATIGCVVSNCRKTFHFRCGREAGGLSQFFQEFRSYCPDHRPSQETHKSDRLAFYGTAKSTCSICMLSVEARASNDTLRSPCCRKAWFHRNCIQRYALSAGAYFFKCPLCNNKDLFEAEMLEFGIYIPEQDAAWEQGPFAYQELLERYNHCDAEKCKCPQGREHDGCPGSRWEIILCDLCGSSGTHTGCHAFTKIGKEDLCKECSEISAVIEQNKRMEKPDQQKPKSSQAAPNMEDVRRQLEQRRSASLRAQRAARRHGASPTLDVSQPTESAQRGNNAALQRNPCPDVLPPAPSVRPRRSVISSAVRKDRCLISRRHVARVKRAETETEVNVMDDDKAPLEAGSDGGVQSSSAALQSAASNDMSSQCLLQPEVSPILSQDLPRREVKRNTQEASCLSPPDLLRAEVTEMFLENSGKTKSSLEHTKAKQTSLVRADEMQILPQANSVLPQDSSQEEVKQDSVQPTTTLRQDLLHSVVMRDTIEYVEVAQSPQRSTYLSTQDIPHTDVTIRKTADIKETEEVKAIVHAAPSQLNNTNETSTLCEQIHIQQSSSLQHSTTQTTAKKLNLRDKQVVDDAETDQHIARSGKREAEEELRSEKLGTTKKKSLRRPRKIRQCQYSTGACEQYGTDISNSHSENTMVKKSNGSMKGIDKNRVNEKTHQHMTRSNSRAAMRQTRFALARSPLSKRPYSFSEQRPVNKSLHIGCRISQSQKKGNRQAYKNKLIKKIDLKQNGFKASLQKPKCEKSSPISIDSISLQKPKCEKPSTISADSFSLQKPSPISTDSAQRPKRGRPQCISPDSAQKPKRGRSCSISTDSAQRPKRRRPCSISMDSVQRPKRGRPCSISTDFAQKQKRGRPGGISLDSAQKQKRGRPGGISMVSAQKQKRGRPGGISMDSSQKPKCGRPGGISLDSAQKQKRGRPRCISMDSAQKPKCGRPGGISLDSAQKQKRGRPRSISMDSAQKPKRGRPGGVSLDSAQKQKRGRPRGISMDSALTPKRGRPGGISLDSAQKQKRGRPRGISSDSALKPKRGKPHSVFTVMDSVQKPKRGGPHYVSPDSVQKPKDGRLYCISTGSVHKLRRGRPRHVSVDSVQKPNDGRLPNVFPNSVQKPKRGRLCHVVQSQQSLDNNKQSETGSDDKINNNSRLSTRLIRSSVVQHLDLCLQHRKSSNSPSENQDFEMFSPPEAAVSQQALEKSRNAASQQVREESKDDKEFMTADVVQTDTVENTQSKLESDSPHSSTSAESMTSVQVRFCPRAVQSASHISTPHNMHGSDDNHEFDSKSQTGLSADDGVVQSSTPAMTALSESGSDCQDNDSAMSAESGIQCDETLWYLMDSDDMSHTQNSAAENENRLFQISGDDNTMCDLLSSENKQNEDDQKKESGLTYLQNGVADSAGMATWKDDCDVDRGESVQLSNFCTDESYVPSSELVCGLDQSPISDLGSSEQSNHNYTLQTQLNTAPLLSPSPFPAASQNTENLLIPEGSSPASLLQKISGFQTGPPQPQFNILCGQEVTSFGHTSCQVPHWSVQSQHTVTASYSSCPVIGFNEMQTHTEYKETIPEQYMVVSPLLPRQPLSVLYPQNYQETCPPVQPSPFGFNTLCVQPVAERCQSYGVVKPQVPAMPSPSFLSSSGNTASDDGLIVIQDKPDALPVHQPDSVPIMPVGITPPPLVRVSESCQGLMSSAQSQMQPVPCVHGLSDIGASSQPQQHPGILTTVMPSQLGQTVPQPSSFTPLSPGTLPSVSSCHSGFESNSGGQQCTAGFNQQGSTLGVYRPGTIPASQFISSSAAPLIDSHPHMNGAMRADNGSSVPLYSCAQSSVWLSASNIIPFNSALGLPFQQQVLFNANSPNQSQLPPYNAGLNQVTQAGNHPVMSSLHSAYPQEERWSDHFNTLPFSSP